MSALLSLLWVPAMVAGFLALNQGAKLVTDVASALARRRGLGNFVIGVLVVSALAILPELAVTGFAIASGAAFLALGNAVGSVIVNLSFMIGLAAVVSPLKATREIVLRDFVFLATVSFVVIVLLLDGNLSRHEGIVLLILFLPYLLNLLITSRTESRDFLDRAMRNLNIELELLGRLSNRFVVIRAHPGWLLLGLAFMIAGAEVVTAGAGSIARAFGVPEFVLGVTVLAVGASLPDIAASLQASKRGNAELALAVPVGSNIFTLLLNLGLIGILAPVLIPTNMILVTAVFIGVQVTLLLAFFLMGDTWEIRRWQGWVLLSLFPLYALIQIVLG
jgi:cation:H+ antiporter